MGPCLLANLRQIANEAEWTGEDRAEIAFELVRLHGSPDNRRMDFVGAKQGHFDAIESLFANGGQQLDFGRSKPRRPDKCVYPEFHSAVLSCRLGAHAEWAAT